MYLPARGARALERGMRTPRRGNRYFGLRLHSSNLTLLWSMARRANSCLRCGDDDKIDPKVAREPHHEELWRAVDPGRFHPHVELGAMGRNTNMTLCSKEHMVELGMGARERRPNFMDGVCVHAPVECTFPK